MALDSAKELRGRQIVAGGLMAGSVITLGVCSFLHFTLRPRGTGLDPFMYLAVAWAVSSPMIAGLVRSRALARPATPGIDPRRTGMIVFFALLEAPAIFCGIALIIVAPWWPLAAAAVPLATMALNFPGSPLESSGSGN